MVAEHKPKSSKGAASAPSAPERGASEKGASEKGAKAKGKGAPEPAPAKAAKPVSPAREAPAKAAPESTPTTEPEPTDDAPRLVLPTTSAIPVSALLLDDSAGAHGGAPGTPRVVLVVRDRVVAADLKTRGLALAPARVRELAAGWAAATARATPRAGGAWLSRDEVDGVFLMLGGLPSALSAEAFRVAFDQAERAARDVAGRMARALGAGSERTEAGPANASASTHAPTPTTEAPAAPLRRPGPPRIVPPDTIKPDPTAPRSLTEHEEREKQQILAALKECSWNQTEAAKVLGMSRRTFVRRLDEFAITEGRRKHRRRG